jgi:hypothetical protein
MVDISLNIKSQTSNSTTLVVICEIYKQIWTLQIDINLDMIVIDAKFLAIKEIN